MKHTHVQLTYFREIGKYYSEGELDVPHITEKGVERPAMFHECINAVQDKLNRGTRPGLVDGRHFDVLATVYTEFGPLSFLFVRDADGSVGTKSARVQRAAW